MRLCQNFLNTLTFQKSLIVIFYQILHKLWVAEVPDRMDDRHTVPILKDYLNDERLSLTQIAELMNFTTLSYFSRYCTKHLDQSPSEYRLSLQPK